MDNSETVLQVIDTATLVENFLSKTGRILKAIELSEERLILVQKMQVLCGFVPIRDHQSAIEGDRMHRESDKKYKEAILTYTFKQAKLYLRQSQYKKAKELYMKTLSITIEIGDRNIEALCYSHLGTVFQSLGEYVKAVVYHHKALQIKTKIGEKCGEATCYENLGAMLQFHGENVKAGEYLQNELQIRKEIGDKCGEAKCYENLAYVYQFLGEYVKAEEYLQNKLRINKEIGDKCGETKCCGNLGTVLKCLGEYVKAEEFIQKALHIKKEIGDKRGEAECYENLGTVCLSLGEYAKAKEYLQKALRIAKEMGDKGGEAKCLANLGNVFESFNESAKALKYLQKALQITNEIGDKEGQAACYANIARVFESLGEHDIKAEQYLQKALGISKEIGNKRVEATCDSNLGDVLYREGRYLKAKEYHEKALSLGNETGCIEIQLESHLSLTLDTLQLTGNIDEAVSNLLATIQKREEMHSFLRDNDRYKISFFETFAFSFKYLSAMFLKAGHFNEALYVEEHARARALQDLMSAQYSVEQQTPVDPRQSWFNIERIGTKESNCCCLYISYFRRDLFLWVIEPNKTVHFRLKDFNDNLGDKKTEKSVEKIFDNVIFRTFRFPLTQEHCEDRSLFPGYVEKASPGGDGPVVFRPVEQGEDDNQCMDPPNLSQCYNMIIAPVANLLEEPEIIIVPDRVLYKVPFSAFKDENGKYLSETFRIRIVPSITTLRLIQESPEDYHSQIGALIVGDPKVGDVYHKGRREKLCPLPGAQEEAEMIGRLLGAEPLIGEHATKLAVLQRIHSAGLIHFASHGNAERGEIALAPPPHLNRIPREEDYLLTVAEISQARLTAKLVVLSCCHSACGRITSEGVVGIARALLGSGARSVLVSLWAIEDLATKQFMSRFYEHLVRGESASESLHQTMEWMRGNGFSEVGQWAPFMLIGDNVSFDFGK